MNFVHMHPAEQIVLLINRIYKKQMTTTSGGNLSILDDKGDIWITPSGIDKGALTTADICQIKPDGRVIGKHRPSVETPFHKHVYKVRPDVKAVLHAHPHSLVSFSLVGKVPNTKIIPLPHLVCGEIGFADYDLPGSEKLGRKISAQFAKGHNVVIMENHGVVTCADNMFNAFKIFETLEHCSKLNIIAKQLGEAAALTDEEIKLNLKKSQKLPDEFQPVEITSQEKKARKEMCALIHRAYDQDLFTSTMGTFSQRLDENNFLITPYGIDRKYLEPEEIVLIQNGLREYGKQPSRSVDLHKLIYNRHPEVNAIVIAQPTHMMAFGITKAPIDPRTIPESYIMIRDLVRVPYGLSILNPQALVDKINRSTPVILAENDFVLTVGSTIINAFDRLEVAEFTAKTIIDATKIGSINPITQDRIDEIDIAFNLK